MTFFWFKRMATAYEAQFGRLVIRYCHLKGNYWHRKPWRRLKVQWRPE